MGDCIVEYNWLNAGYKDTCKTRPGGVMGGNIIEYIGRNTGNKDTCKDKTGVCDG